MNQRDNTANQVLDGGGTTFTPMTALTPGHSYSWYARA